MATVAWTATGDTSFSFTARRWSPWLPTSARTFLPVLSVISVSPAKAALSRPWMEGRLSKNDCAYASAARPITRSTASTAPSPRRIAVRRIFCPIGDHAAWIRARGLCPPFVFIRSGTFRAMDGGAQGFYAFPSCPTPGGRRGLRPPQAADQAVPGESPFLGIDGAEEVDRDRVHDEPCRSGQEDRVAARRIQREPHEDPGQQDSPAQPDHRQAKLRSSDLHEPPTERAQRRFGQHRGNARTDVAEEQDGDQIQPDRDDCGKARRPCVEALPVRCVEHRVKRRVGKQEDDAESEDAKRR